MDSKRVVGGVVLTERRQGEAKQKGNGASQRPRAGVHGAFLRFGLRRRHATAAGVAKPCVPRTAETAHSAVPVLSPKIRFLG